MIAEAVTLEQAMTFKPHDHQWLQEASELVRSKVPDTHTFVVFAIPKSGADRCYYASNAEHADAIAALKEWIVYQEKLKNWLKSGVKSPPPSPHST